MTVPSPRVDGEELSIFIRATPDEILSDLAGRLHPPGLIEPILHPASSRAEGAPRSSLSGHPLIMQPIQDDIGLGPDLEGVRRVYSGSKLGGEPYWLRPSAEVQDASRQVEGGRLRLIVQLDFPSSGDVVGDWPFADGYLYLFGRSPWDEGDWRIMWDV